MNRTLIRLTTLPARLPRTLSKAALFAAPATLFASLADYGRCRSVQHGHRRPDDLPVSPGSIMNLLPLVPSAHPSARLAR